MLNFRFMTKNSSISSINKGQEQDVKRIVNCKNQNCHNYISKKKNSVMINEPYKFDENIILACSNVFSAKKGFKTAGTSISHKKHSRSPIKEVKNDACVMAEHANQWKSPQAKTKEYFHHTAGMFYNEKEILLSQQKPANHDTLESAHAEPKRDISPYRIENFIEMLHNFGISDADIKKKFMYNPISNSNFCAELSSDVQNDASLLMKM